MNVNSSTEICQLSYQYIYMYMLFLHIVNFRSTVCLIWIEKYAILKIWKIKFVFQILYTYQVKKISYLSNKRKITHDIVPIQIVVNTAINKSSVYLLRKNCDSIKK